MLINKFAAFIKKVLSNTLGLPTSREGIKSLFRVSLYRNAVYLMLNSTMLALTGFFFWIAAARLYPTEVVGLASSAIAAIGLLSLLSTLGLDYGLIRFLPGAGDKAREMINSCFTIGGTVSILFALIFLAGLGIWSPALLPLRDNLLYLFAFIIFAFTTTIHTLNNQCFIAARKSRFAMAQGWLAGFLRFIPLVILASSFQKFGIFVSWGIAISFAAVIAIIFFLPRTYNGYHPLPSIRKDVVGEMLRFSFANYIANIFWMIPQLVLPIMVVNLLGAEQNAYFYIGWSTAGIVFMIPTATSLSLLAEASHDEKKLNQEMKRSLKLILLLLVPAIIVLLLLGDTILLFFGRAYSEKAPELLWILAVSALPLSLNHVYFTIRRVEKKMQSVIWLTAFIAIATLVSSYFLLPVMGIKGAGIGWLIGQGTAALLTFPYLWRRFFRKPSNPS
ncbi:MAG: oligosaccharide flippase family protein [Dehalococcoidales bacterium]|nr:oligosaccharide flippase family protein [Dehalococcoidales bacterium]